MVSYGLRDGDKRLHRHRKLLLGQPDRVREEPSRYRLQMTEWSEEVRLHVSESPLGEYVLVLLVLDDETCFFSDDVVHVEEAARKWEGTVW